MLFTKSRTSMLTRVDTHTHFDYKRAWGNLAPVLGKKKEGTGNPRKSENAWRFMKLEKRSVSFTPQSEITFKKYLLYMYIYMYIFLICKCKENQLLSAKEKKKGGGGNLREGHL